MCAVALMPKKRAPNPKEGIIREERGSDDNIMHLRWENCNECFCRDSGKLSAFDQEVNLAGRRKRQSESELQPALAGDVDLRRTPP